ncbi:hypothetical protein [uncultured Holdemania sp.]|uniref:hypothetical protein n=1 Tax=uncultured Holdemania sp. TaxID=527664 RepID=UPI0025F0F718|nr:hypothetical protein [uncultured Holdemania sp.]
MKRKFNEWFSVQLAKNPSKMVLAVILLFNIMFFLLSAFIINSLAVSGTEKMGFLETVFYTITMILDAGCISFIIEDVGKSGVFIAIVCLCTIVVGMISFTGAVIGYITNYISSFIENANSRSKKISISNHVVILNWNTRASEIINDLLYSETYQKVVVLVSSKKAEIEMEIEERLNDTIARENESLILQCKNMNIIKRYFTYRREQFKKNITVIVKEGDVFSSRQLADISLERAKTVIILGNDINNTICKFELRDRLEEKSQGNSQTVKTLMQVADITASENSIDDQKIIVEITDDWTWEIVEKIIKCKQVDQKCNIVPIRINKILGQILSQFSLMPELNLAYKELFSNKGATFYSEVHSPENDITFISNYLDNHNHAIPLTIMDNKGKSHAYYSSSAEREIHQINTIKTKNYSVKLNEQYWLERKNVIILGHNSKCRDLMQGFCAFRNEWNYRNSDEEILKIIIIDDQKSLDKMNNYKDYPFVETVTASIYDKDIICSTIEKFVSSNEEDTSILILSDDEMLNENIDANALANLVYVQDIINDKKIKNPDFDEESIDVIVEIINPKHHDIVSSYSVNNVVISNRYISKMITQIGAKEALFDFYTDILTYDTDDSGVYNSKEIYIKEVCKFFEELPKPCFAEEFIRAVYHASLDESLPKEKQNPTIVLGYVKPGGKMILFEGDQSNVKVELDYKDKLIVFSNH